MTVLIGYSCSAFTIIGADSRGISIDDSSDIDDDCRKIFKTGFGVIAGAGRTDIINAIAARLETEAPPSNHAASSIIRAEIEALGLPANDPGLERTCWLGSYMAADGTGTQLAFALRELNYSFDRFPHDYVYLVSPAGMSQEVARKVRESAQTQLQSQMRRLPPEAHLHTCIRMVAGLVSAISESFHSVGPRWSVGVHHSATNTTAISRIGDDPDNLAWY